ncbi:MAG: glycosyltransferase family 2 protein [Acidimicrobiales bacterium]|nr:glycosyltransferase family 2 protein [Acidimicrobiales bacterium]
MDSRVPEVSIGLPVYNGERFLARAIDALLAQEFTDFELIVADNASTDSTLEIADRYAALDPRVSVHRSAENRGAAWNFNRTLDLARGRFFKWAAYDDLCAPGFVARCHEVLASGSDSVVLAYPRTLVIDDDDEVVGEWDDGLDLTEPTAHERLAHLLRRPEFHAVFGLIRTDVLRQTGAIGPFVASDVALLAELALVGTFHEVPEPLFLRRFHADTSVNANPDYADRAAWFDPARSGQLTFAMARMTWELLKRVWAADLPAAERLRCTVSVTRHWTIPHGREAGGEVKLALRQVVARARRRVSS